MEKKGVKFKIMKINDLLTIWRPPQHRYTPVAKLSCTHSMEILHLVASVCPFVCLLVIALKAEPTITQKHI